jgi:alkylhydroperoxidase/carboxymuconolactone decarboxylase family protein YurZ
LADPQSRLRDLAAGEDDGGRCDVLDRKTDALIRLGALVALGASPPSYVGTIKTALAVGATVDEIVETLVAVANTVGLARVVSASPGLARGLDYDIDAALEDPMRPSNDI